MTSLLQLTLDFFSSEPWPGFAGGFTPAEKPKKKTPKAVNLKDPIAPEVVANHSANPEPAWSGMAFGHPQASRQARLGGVLVAYALKRSKRRTIGFVVGHDGLAVSAPKWVPLYEIDRAVQEKTGWILRKLQETQEKHQRLQAAQVDWQDGAVFSFLGRTLTVVLDPSHRFTGVGAQLLETPAPLASTTEANPPEDHTHAPTWTLHIGLPHNASSAQIRDAAQAWLMQQAKLFFTERLEHFAPQLGVTWRRLGLSNAGTRWGSASADGCIRLNWRLMHLKPAVIDYVVVHELSHLRVMNHSPLFWDTVRTVMPNYAGLRSQLKDTNMPQW